MSNTDSETAFLRTVSTLGRRMRTLFDARTAEYGLTHARARILLLLIDKAPMTQAELADAMDVERPTMARLLDGMETSGLLRREFSPEDRRQRHIFLTETAQDDAQAVLALTDRLRADVLAGVPQEDLAVADRVLCRMLENVAKAG